MKHITDLCLEGLLINEKSSGGNTDGLGFFAGVFASVFGLNDSKKGSDKGSDSSKKTVDSPYTEMCKAVFAAKQDQLKRRMEAQKKERETLIRIEKERRVAEIKERTAYEAQQAALRQKLLDASLQEMKQQNGEYDNMLKEIDKGNLLLFTNERCMAVRDRINTIVKDCPDLGAVQNQIELADNIDKIFYDDDGNYIGDNSEMITKRLKSVYGENYLETMESYGVKIGAVPITEENLHKVVEIDTPKNVAYRERTLRIAEREIDTHNAQKEQLEKELAEAKARSKANDTNTQADDKIKNIDNKIAAYNQTENATKPDIADINADIKKRIEDITALHENTDDESTNKRKELAQKLVDDLEAAGIPLTDQEKEELKNVTTAQALNKKVNSINDKYKSEIKDKCVERLEKEKETVEQSKQETSGPKYFMKDKNGKYVEIQKDENGKFFTKNSLGIKKSVAEADVVSEEAKLNDEIRQVNKRINEACKTVNCSNPEEVKALHKEKQHYMERNGIKEYPDDATQKDIDKTNEENDKRAKEMYKEHSQEIKEKMNKSSNDREYQQFKADNIKPQDITADLGIGENDEITYIDGDGIPRTVKKDDCEPEEWTKYIQIAAAQSIYSEKELKKPDISQYDLNDPKQKAKFVEKVKKYEQQQNKRALLKEIQDKYKDDDDIFLKPKDENGNKIVVRDGKAYTVDKNGNETEYKVDSRDETDDEYNSKNKKIKNEIGSGNEDTDLDDEDAKKYGEDEVEVVGDKKKLKNPKLVWHTRPRKDGKGETQSYFNKKGDSISKRDFQKKVKNFEKMKQKAKNKPQKPQTPETPNKTPEPQQQNSSLQYDMTLTQYLLEHIC